MPVYHCMIELHSDARALAFAAATANWCGHLEGRGLVSGWRLMRRTLGLGSWAHPDFILELDLPALSSLETVFTTLGSADDDSVRRYDQMHQMIARVDAGLYRPFPDPELRERIALI